MGRSPDDEMGCSLTKRNRNNFVVVLDVASVERRQVTANYIHKKKTARMVHQASMAGKTGDR